MKLRITLLYYTKIFFTSFLCFSALWCSQVIDCIFKYKCDLFSENEVITTPTFKVDPGNEFQEITKGCSNTFVIHPNIKAASVKHSLENQILNIKIFDQDNQMPAYVKLIVHVTSSASCKGF